MKFILAQKQKMTQIFIDSGDAIPVTLVKAEPCRVIRIKTADSKDGYNSVVVGLPGKKKLGKRELGQAKGFGNLQYIKEFRLDEVPELKDGDTITVGTFEVGDKLKVVGTSKGKGFQGVVKRHGFHGQQATHGTKDQERAPGSIGPTEPARVFPGMRMPGHMGNARITVKNLEVVKIDVQKGEIYIKGAVPGYKGSLLYITAPGELKVNQKIDKAGEEDANKKEDIPDDLTDKKEANEPSAEDKNSNEQSAKGTEKKVGNVANKEEPK